MPPPHTLTDIEFPTGSLSTPGREFVSCLPEVMAKTELERGQTLGREHGQRTRSDSEQP